MFFSHLGLLGGNLFLIAPFPDLCLLNCTFCYCTDRPVCVGPVRKLHCCFSNATAHLCQLDQVEKTCGGPEYESARYSIHPKI